MVGSFVLHIEGLCHIKPIQPDLMGIDLFVPEIPSRGAGLYVQLAVYRIDGTAVFFLPSESVELKQGFSCIYIVQIAFLGVVGLNGAVLPDKMVDEGIGKVQVFLFFCNEIQLQDGLDHTTINIIPGRTSAAADFFNVPYRSFRGALIDELVDVTV